MEQLLCVDFLLVLLHPMVSGSDERLATDEREEYLSGKVEVEEDEGEDRTAENIVDEEKPEKI